MISVPALAFQLIDKHIHLSCHVRVEFTETGRLANGHFANVSRQFANVIYMSTCVLTKRFRILYFA